MTFDEAYARIEGYLWRHYEVEGRKWPLDALDELRVAHGEDVKQALCRFPLHDKLVEYDVAGNARHKALCDLRKWDPDKVKPVPGEHDTHIKILYQILVGKAGGNVSASDAAKAVRDKLVELLEA